ncbi:MAG: hypothetical protein OXE98_01585 [Hyphomicrobiales bacterium]|nr:hypothetical protein [Hyphomicrobiales bacterium]
MKTRTTLTTFVTSLIVIGFAGATSAHAGEPLMVDTEAAKLKTCVELEFDNCPQAQITALGPLDDEPGAQSAAAEQSPETPGNEDIVVENGNFSLARQTLTERIFNSHINELFADVPIPKHSFSSGENSFLASGIGFFGPRHTLEAAEPLGLHDPLLFQIGAGIGINKNFSGGK